VESALPKKVAVDDDAQFDDIESDDVELEGKIPGWGADVENGGGTPGCDADAPPARNAEGCRASRAARAAGAVDRAPAKRRRRLPLLRPAKTNAALASRDDIF
jgi:hypothetical protein